MSKRARLGGRPEAWMVANDGGAGGCSREGPGDPGGAAAPVGSGATGPAAMPAAVSGATSGAMPATAPGSGSRSSGHRHTRRC